jgi:hypothetical protein
LIKGANYVLPTIALNREIGFVCCVYMLYVLYTDPCHNLRRKVKAWSQLSHSNNQSLSHLLSRRLIDTAFLRVVIDYVAVRHFFDKLTF